MKPRRWYSSTELNPDPRPRNDQVSPRSIYWQYTAHARAEYTQVIRQLAPAKTDQGNAPTPIARPFRRIEAA